MKSHPNLWPRITSFENLFDAFRRARRAKRARPDVAAFEFDLERNLFDLQRELLDGTYRPGGYRHFVVHEPTERKINAAPFRDRVVHHALCAVIEPLFDRVFLPHSFANRVGRGTHRALDRCQSLVKRHRYVLKADVSKFFPSVDHEILYALVIRRIRCRPTYRMTWFPGDTLLSPLDRARGLPIGNLTSQFWANVYLHELDRFAVGELRWDAYVRYVDDFLPLRGRQTRFARGVATDRGFPAVAAADVASDEDTSFARCDWGAVSGLRVAAGPGAAQARSGQTIHAAHAPVSRPACRAFPFDDSVDHVRAELDRACRLRPDVPAPRDADGRPRVRG